MGIEYYLADIKNRRQYELGKALNFDLEELKGGPERVLEAVGRLYTLRYGTFEPGDNAVQIAAEVWAFCESVGWDVSVRNDCTDYDDEWDENNQWIDFLQVGGVFQPEHRLDPPFDPDPLAEHMAELKAKALKQLQEKP